jgi:hypothetical protein
MKLMKRSKNLKLPADVWKFYILMFLDFDDRHENSVSVSKFLYKIIDELRSPSLLYNQDICKNIWPMTQPFFRLNNALGVHP